MTPHAHVFVLIGPSGSGKSTLVKHLCDRHRVLAVNDDLIVNMLHGGCYNRYSRALKPLYKILECTAIHVAVTHDTPVIYDRGLNISRSGRSRIIALANSLDVGCTAIVMPALSATELLRRRTASEENMRGLKKSVWQSIISRHLKEYEAPSLDEGFCKILRPTVADITPDEDKPYHQQLAIQKLM